MLPARLVCGLDIRRNCGLAPRGESSIMGADMYVYLWSLRNILFLWEIPQGLLLSR